MDIFNVFADLFICILAFRLFYVHHNLSFGGIEMLISRSYILKSLLLLLILLLLLLLVAG